MVQFFFCLLLLIPLFVGYQPRDIHLKLAIAAMEQVGVTTIYAPGYFRLSYPGGDLPPEQGVCADVVIRAFRKVGIDLQKEVHEDMTNHFNEYPKFRNMKSPDPNIDHRRVPNLMRFLKRSGKALRIDSEYEPGDIVAWQLEHGLFHIGIVSAGVVPDEKRYYMIHNIGAGTKKEDILRKFKIIGHYRW
jgi:uncharacterized protein YijF (DUF1287 family)